MMSFGEGDFVRRYLLYYNAAHGTRWAFRMDGRNEWLYASFLR